MKLETFLREEYDSLSKQRVGVRKAIKLKEKELKAVSERMRVIKEFLGEQISFTDEEAD